MGKPSYPSPLPTSVAKPTTSVASGTSAGTASVAVRSPPRRRLPRQHRREAGDAAGRGGRGRQLECHKCQRQRRLAVSAQVRKKGEKNKTGHAKLCCFQRRRSLPFLLSPHERVVGESSFRRFRLGFFDRKALLEPETRARRTGRETSDCKAAHV